MKKSHSDLWQVREVFKAGPLLSHFDHPRANILKNVGQAMQRTRVGFMREGEKIATIFISGAMSPKDADMLPIVIDLAQKHWTDQYGWRSLEGWDEITINLTDFISREKHEDALRCSAFAAIHRSPRYPSVLDSLNVAGRTLKAFEDKSLDDFDGETSEEREAEKEKQREGVLEAVTNQLYYGYMVHSMEYETIGPRILKRQQEVSPFEKLFRTTP